MSNTRHTTRRASGAARKAVWMLLMFFAMPLAALALDPALTVFQYNCQNWSRRNGLPVNGIRAITQTDDGYLWLGTQQGLVRFDGKTFTPFSVPDEPMFVSQNISALARSRKGGLWFGLKEGALGYFDGEHFAPLVAPWVEPNMQTVAVMEARDGSVWTGWNFGYSRWSENRLAEGPAEQFIGTVPFHAVHEDAKGRIWLGSGDSGQLFYVENGERHALPVPGGDLLYFYAIADDPEGRVWFGTQRGLYSYDGRFRQVPLPVREMTGRVGALLVDRHGVLWIGTDGAGLFTLKNGKFSRFTTAEGLVDNNVLSLHEDAEGSVWVGTQGGLTQLSDVKFPIQSVTEGLAAEPLGVAPAANGALWVATTRGITHLNGRTATTYADGLGFTNLWMKRVWEAKDGDLYVFDGDRGVIVMADGKIVARHVRREWPVAITEDARGVLVSLGPEIFRASREGLTPLEHKQEKPDTAWVVNMWPARDGSLWAATHRGVWRFHEGEHQQWSTHNGLASSVANWVFEDVDGAIWAGLASGVARIKNGEVRNISRADGLFANFIHTIVPDDFGWFWIDSSEGIFRVRRQELNDFADRRISRISPELFNGSNAVKATDKGHQEPTAARTADGRIWFPTVQGVVTIDPASVPMNRVAPPVYIERARVNGREMDRRAALEPRAGRGELEFHYTAVTFLAPEKVRFRYLLHGYDETWIEADNRRSAFYTNLAPGRYVFRVQACNADGVWSTEGDELAVELPPHFYQTRWFATVCALGLLAMLFGAYMWRMRAHWRRQKSLQEANDLLETRVHRRTAELEQTNSRLRAEIAERRRVELEATETNKQLLLASRQAGMAEVATSVLHNVGNVLNSVNVSAGLLAEQLRSSRVVNVPKVAKLLEENASKPDFLQADERGKKVPGYLMQLSDHLAAEHGRMRTEVDALRKNVEHIKDIVQMQQSYSRMSGVSEHVTLREIVDDTLRLNGASTERHDVTIEREVEDGVTVMVEKHKVLQILVNLVRNATIACREANRTDGLVRLRARRHGADFVRIEVFDNGTGIPPENLTRIFTQGFTTRKTGHGYGLHSSANAAKAMGGSLSAQSDGPGQGAVFTLDLPVKPRGQAPVGSRAPFSAGGRNPRSGEAWSQVRADSSETKVT